MMDTGRDRRNSQVEQSTFDPIAFVTLSRVVKRATVHCWIAKETANS